MVSKRILTIGLFGALPLALAHADADSAANGELAFYRNCESCHSLEKGQNKIGPSLFSIHGRKSALAEGYSYSATLRQLDLTWADANLDAYLTDAQKYAPGAKMWLKLPDTRTRKDIIGFLKAQTARAELDALRANGAGRRYER